MTDPADLRAEEAAAWVVRMDLEPWSEAREAELQVWLNGDRRNAGALLHAQAVWAGATEPAAEAAPQQPARPMLVSRRVLVAGGGTAIAAGIAGLAFLDSGARYDTQVGEIRRVPLADGSVASINTGSDITVWLKSSERRVAIHRGEAWFAVAKDRSRPFTVETGRIRAVAVGTAFSVRRRAGGADVLVTEGIVKAWQDGASTPPFEIRPGQAAFLPEDAAIRPHFYAEASVDRMLAWRNGMIDLGGRTLYEAATEFNRYNRRQIVITDPRAGQERFDGIFGINDPEGFAIVAHDNLAIPVNMSDPAEIRLGYGVTRS